MLKGRERLVDSTRPRNLVLPRAVQACIVRTKDEHPGELEGAVMKRQRLRAPEAPLPDEAFLSALRSELGRARLLCRAVNKPSPQPRRDDLAALFARRALEAFAAEKAPSLKLSQPFAKPFGKLDRAAEQLADSVGGDAAKLPLAEGLHYVSSLYPALLSEHSRSTLGAYYTPPCLTARLLDQATDHDLDWATARILDPAAGAGAFLVEAALRMRDAVADSERVFALRQIGARLLGLEIDPHAASLAQAALEIALSDLSTATGVVVPVMIRVCDTLEETPDQAFDLVIGNPPYGRVTLTVEQRARFARSLYGHANLYGVFTDIALRWAKPGGLIAYLTPASFLAGQYYSSLRRLLADEAPPVAIDFVHARKGVFEDVLQETLLAVYRKGQARGRAQIQYIQVASEREAHLTRNGTIGLPIDSGAPWLAPRLPEHSALIAKAEQMSARLRDWGYSVSTGPLVWNRFKPQLRDRAGGNNVHPLVWAECVTADGRFIFRALKKNHSPFFKLERGDRWLLVEEPCVLVQRTTAKEQARRLIAAELPAEFVKDHGGVVVENHLNMVRASASPKVAPGVVAAILNSTVVDEVFRCMNGSVAVSAFELESLPLPKVAALSRLAALVAGRAERVKIDAECDRLYGRAPQ